MTRRVRRKGSKSKDKNKAVIENNSEIIDNGCFNTDTYYAVDWTTLPADIVVLLFSYLNYRDRASLSSTCRTFRLLGSNPCLWDSLDLRFHKFDAATAVALSSRSATTQMLHFRGAKSADAIIGLQARSLCEIRGDCCQDITDATLSVIAARHEMLESLQLGPDSCERITSDSIKVVAFCCRKLRQLRLAGVRNVSGDAINALAKHCGQLLEVGFTDCEDVDGVALRNLISVRYLSVAGTKNLNWGPRSQMLSLFPNLMGLDVSRTDISARTIPRLLSSSQNLKVLFALNCPVFEAEVDNNTLYNQKGKVLISLYSDILKGVASLFADTLGNERDVLLYWRKLKHGNKNLDEMVSWIEWVLSHSLLRIAENNPIEFDGFWLEQGASILLSLLQSSQEDVQERAATAVATFVVIDDENASVDSQRAEVVMKSGGIRLLLNLARSCREGLQSEAARAIANLSVDSKVAKAFAKIGGINILATLARSMNRLIAEEAAGGLCNLSVGEEHKGAIAEAGGIKALVDLIFKWPSGGDGVIERAAGALANLAVDGKCCIEVALAGGVHALVMISQSCEFEGVQEQATRALANLAVHGDGNDNNVGYGAGQGTGALEALVKLTCSQHEGVRQEAAGALWNLSFDDKNREAIAAAGGVKALVTLAQSCSNSSRCLQERAAGALWGLSVSEVNSIAIVQEGGVAPLIALACSDIEDVHQTATGALWNLAFNPDNAFRILEDRGVPALIRLCYSSLSKMARFMAVLALGYMFDGRMEEIASASPSLEGNSQSINIGWFRGIALSHIGKFVRAYYDPQSFATAVVSSAPTALAQVAEAARIQEAGHLRCSEAEIGRFVTMLRNPSCTLKTCAAFALLQFTLPGGRHAMHHTSILQNSGAARVLRAASASATAPIAAKVFGRVVLRNLEHHQMEASFNAKARKVAM